MSQPKPVITLEDLAIIRSTYAIAARPSNGTAARFYAALFRIDPSLRGLFHGDLNSQGEKLINMLTLVVSNLERLELLTPTLRQLGQRHSGYGVTDGHYVTVGTALIKTLEDEAGAAWTPEASVAWKKIYAFLAENMTGKPL